MGQSLMIQSGYQHRNTLISTPMNHSKITIDWSSPLNQYVFIFLSLSSFIYSQLMNNVNPANMIWYIVAAYIWLK